MGEQGWYGMRKKDATLKQMPLTNSSEARFRIQADVPIVELIRKLFYSGF